MTTRQLIVLNIYVVIIGYAILALRYGLPWLWSLMQ